MVRLHVPGNPSLAETLTADSAEDARGTVYRRTQTLVLMTVVFKKSALDAESAPKLVHSAGAVGTVAFLAFETIPTLHRDVSGCFMRARLKKNTSRVRKRYLLNSLTLSGVRDLHNRTKPNIDEH